MFPLSSLYWQHDELGHEMVSDVSNTGCFNLELTFSSAFLLMVSADGSRSKIIGREKWKQAETGFLPFRDNISTGRFGRTKP